MKRLTAILAAAVLLMLQACALADRIPEKKSRNYIGAMRVVYCKEYVTLREEPRKTSMSLMHVPLGEIVYSCTKIKSELFVQCEYQGQTGYILKKYLQPAPEFEPPVSSAISMKMTLEEVTEDGETVLEWNDYNISVVAARSMGKIEGKDSEILRIGCFLDGEPLWGHVETVENNGQHSLLKVFIGGTEDDPQVMLFDGGYGLTMIDLLSGKEKWTVNIGNCPMGDAAVTAVNDIGVIYLAGTDGPHPVAISADGHVLWRSEISNPSVYEPYEMEVVNGLILVKYRSGMTDGYKLVTLDGTGELMEIREEKDS
ncbi:MAG: hypothetical protein IKQ45_01930 [Clostridia bacterium]|nr:hypothetical protein [Clostridia bacterium]